MNAETELLTGCFDADTARRTNSSRRLQSATELRKIDKLRGQHTQAFNAGDWVAMQRIGTQIIKRWDMYHARKDREAGA